MQHAYGSKQTVLTLRAMLVNKGELLMTRRSCREDALSVGILVLLRRLD